MIVFYDTNVLTYSVDASEPVKQSIALNRLSHDLSHHTVVVSTQVLQELYNTMTHQFKLAFNAESSRSYLKTFSVLQIIAPTMQSILKASEIHEQEQISWWDALIIESAQRAGADQLLSEDLQHGRKFGRMKVVNPFV